MAKENTKQAKAVCRSIRTSSRKLNLVAQTIRGLSVEKAVAELSFSKKRIAKVALKLLNSGVSEASCERTLSTQKLIYKWIDGEKDHMAWEAQYLNYIDKLGYENFLTAMM